MFYLISLKKFGMSESYTLCSAITQNVCSINFNFTFVRVFGVSSGPCWTDFLTIALVYLQDLSGQKLISREARSNWSSDNRWSIRCKTFTSWILFNWEWWFNLIEKYNEFWVSIPRRLWNRFLGFQVRNQELSSLGLNMFMTHLLLKVFVSRYLCIQSLTVLSVPQILFV